MSEIDVPALIDWREGGKVHNWRNHVGQEVKALWYDLPYVVRLAIAKDAQVLANAEEWD